MFKVYINDSKSGSYTDNALYFNHVSMWALEHCASYSGYDVIDFGDTSIVWGNTGEYKFTDEQDATLFTLKWK